MTMHRASLLAGTPRWAAWSALVIPAAGLCTAALYRTQPAARVAVPLPVAAPAAAAELPDGKLRIGLVSLSGGDALGMKSGSAARITDARTGEWLKAVPANAPIRVVADYATGQVLMKGPRIYVERPALEFSGGIVQIGSRRYPGKIRFELGGTGLQLVNELDIEQYLQGVLPGEIPASFGLEAQKAQAVAARSYALAQRGKHGTFDLCDRTCCQMYIGVTQATGKALAAVKATRHLCLWSGRKIAYAFFSADCGGLSAQVDDVPLRDKPAEHLDYLRIVRDAPRGGGTDYCCTSPYHQWTRRLTAQQIEARLNARPETYVGTFQELKVLDYDGSGRMHSVRLRGEEPAQVASTEPVAAPGTPVEKVVTGWELRRSLGALTLKSTRLKVDQPEPGIYRFTGRGFGHGLGLCQIGANGMAARGLTFRQILAHYYPGAKIAPLPR